MFKVWGSFKMMFETETIDKLFGAFMILFIVAILFFIVMVIIDSYNFINKYEFCFDEIGKQVCEDKGMYFSESFKGGFGDYYFECTNELRSLETKRFKFLDNEVNKCTR